MATAALAPNRRRAAAPCAGRGTIGRVPSPRVKQVALAFPIGVPYTERITRGVVEYAREHGPWHFAFSPEAVTVPVESLAGHVDGILAFASSRAEARRVARLGLPAVNLSGALPAAGLPVVTVENRAVGRMAAEHLMERGFRRFAYYGVGDVSYGRERGAGFVEAVRAAGHACEVCFARSGLDRGRPSLVDRGQLRAWLRRLRPPVGLMAVHDYRARVVLEACATLGLRVPDEVAVIGVDDDVTLCELATPSLSSVALPGLEIGRRAAELLDRLMRGERPPAQSILVPPRDLVARRSTDVLAFEDPAVAELVRLIHERLGEPLNVAQVAGEAGVSRRLVERRFRAALGITPHDYISRARVDRAKRLLVAAPQPSLKDVAARCGFTDARRMTQAFRRVEGMTPAEFRSRTPSQNGARRS